MWITISFVSFVVKCSVISATHNIHFNISALNISLIFVIFNQYTIIIHRFVTIIKLRNSNHLSFVIYKETANYSFSDGKFSYTSTVKKLNSLDSEEEFTTTEKEGKVDSAYFLELSVNLLEDVTVENGVLKAKLSVSGLEKLVNKDAKDGSLELKFNDDKVVSLVLVYTLNGQKTKIEANYSY